MQFQCLFLSTWILGLATTAMAVTDLESQAKAGDANSQNELGELYLRGESVPVDCKKAKQWYDKAADQKHSNAQLKLGVIYQQGECVPKDYKKAAEWYTKSGQQGNLIATFYLGLMYEFDMKKPQKAADAYAKCGEQGAGYCQFALGKMKEEGRGIKPDIVLAYALYNLASASDDPVASRDGRKNRDELSAKMSQSQISEAQAIASSWKLGQHFPASSKTGSSAARSKPSLSSGKQQ